MSTFVNYNTQQQTTSAGTLGVAAGKVIYTNTSLPVYLNSVALIYTATATVGNRAVLFVIKDSSGNVIWRAAQAINVTAGQVVNIQAGSGIPVSSAGGILITTFPSPAFFPANGTLTVADGANIDTADSLSAGQIVVQY